MKIAICFSGMIRTGLRCIPNITNFIGDLGDDVDFFMHTWDEDYQGPFFGEKWDDLELITKKCGIKLDNEKLNKFIDAYKFKSYIVENNFVTLNRISDYYKNVSPDKTDWWIPLFYSWAVSIDLKRAYERKHGFRYRYVIKLRPDILFGPDIKLRDLLNRIDNESIGINHISGPVDALSADDIFFISNSPIMDIASRFYISRLKSLEYLSKESHVSFYNFIVRCKIKPKDIGLGYLGEHDAISLLRNESPEFNVITEYKKLMEVDKILYHTLHSKKVSYLTPRDIVQLCNRIELLNKKLTPSLAAWKNENSNLF